jgi:hypothetical protein
MTERPVGRSGLRLRVLQSPTNLTGVQRMTPRGRQHLLRYTIPLL